MYTKLDDMKLAHKVNKVLQEEPSITQKELCMKLITNWHRLKYLEQQGYFILNRRNANDAKTNTLICE
jgi:hypothetical protein